MGRNQHRSRTGPTCKVDPREGTVLVVGPEGGGSAAVDATSFGISVGFALAFIGIARSQFGTSGNKSFTIRTAAIQADNHVESIGEILPFDTQGRSATEDQFSPAVDVDQTCGNQQAKAPQRFTNTERFAFCISIHAPQGGAVSIGQSSDSVGDPAAKNDRQAITATGSYAPIGSVAIGIGCSGPAKFGYYAGYTLQIGEPLYDADSIEEGWVVIAGGISRTKAP